MKIIPIEQDTNETWWVWGPASTTLEYCLCDWGLAQMARRLGKQEGVPLFARAVVSLHPGYYPGKELVISADGDLSDARRVSCELNGKPYQQAWIDHKDIVSGGNLRFSPSHGVLTPEE